MDLTVMDLTVTHGKEREERLGVACGLAPGSVSTTTRGEWQRGRPPVPNSSPCPGVSRRIHAHIDRRCRRTERDRPTTRAKTSSSESSTSQ